jgi:glycerol kinase
MEHSPHYLVLDQGSHASKALIFNQAGNVLAAGEAPVATRQPHPGWVEHDAEALIHSLEQAIAEARAGSGLGECRLAGAGLAIQRSSVVCWHRENGAALSPVLSWQDRRNAGWLADRQFDPARLREITGLVASPHYGASKLRWCLDHVPAVREAQAEGTLCWGPLASFVLHRLLAERPFMVDPANAARTMLWDLRSRDWSEEMIEACGLPVGSLPHCVPSRHDFGTLQAGGLEAPMQIVTGDQSAALFAWGDPDARALFVNIGTGAFVQRLVPGTPPSAPGLLQGVAWQDGERSIGVLEGTVNGAGAALQWLAQARGVSAETLVEDADRWLDECGDPPLFVNGVGGLGSPWWRADSPIRFSVDATLAAETVAVLESIAFLLHVNIAAIGAATEPGHGPAHRVIVSGGLARFEGLCQRLADLCGLEVQRPAAIEATAQGVAWLLSGVTHVSESPRRFLPQRNAALHARFDRWRALMG